MAGSLQIVIGVILVLAVHESLGKCKSNQIFSNLYKRQGKWKICLEHLKLNVTVLSVQL